MVNRVEEKRIIKERNEKRKYRDEIQIYTTSSGDTSAVLPFHARAPRAEGRFAT
jgi:hypothetical protein